MKPEERKKLAIKTLKEIDNIKTTYWLGYKRGILDLYPELEE
jgi:hypothetical protein